jgi:hypothetical protein
MLAFWHAVAPNAVSTKISYGSMNVVGPLDAYLIAATAVVGAVLIVLIYIKMITLSKHTTSPVDQARILVVVVVISLAIVITFSKVSSLQYLVWLIPLGAISSLATKSDWTIAAFIVTMVLAQVVFPFTTSADTRLEPWSFGIVLARHVLLLVWVSRIYLWLTKTPSRDPDFPINLVGFRRTVNAID